MKLLCHQPILRGGGPRMRSTAWPWIQSQLLNDTPVKLDTKALMSCLAWHAVCGVTQQSAGEAMRSDSTERTEEASYL